MQEAAFRNLPEIYAINLSHNAISEIEPGAFDNVPLLMVLDLSYNKLETIPGKVISDLPSLQMLYLNNNSWNCSCEMTWVLNLSSSLVHSQAVCEYPAVLKGTLLHQLTRWDFLNCFTIDSLIGMNGVYFILTNIILIIGTFLWYLYSKPTEQADKNLKIFGRIKYNSKDFLGEKNNVFKGTFRDGPHYEHVAAIKVHQQNLGPKEVRVFHRLQEAPSHPNVIRYLGFEEDLVAKITYVALDLCGGNLKEAVIDHKEKFLPHLTPGCCLKQIASGVQLHGLQTPVQHRDLKPQNVLWKEYADEIHFIIADFDLCHISDDKSSSHRNMYGTLGWMAPELSHKNKRTTAVDIFSLGCVFYYALTALWPNG